MIKEGISNHMSVRNNNGYINGLNQNVKYFQNNMIKQQNNYCNNISEEKSKTEYNNIILDKNYNSKEPITGKGIPSYQLKKPIF